MRGNAIIGQSGGPSSVINTTLAAIIEQAKHSTMIQSVYGMCNGIEGLLNDRLIDLGKQEISTIEALKQTPGSILGASRYKFADTDFPKILTQLKKYNIRYFFQLGGNGTMASLHTIGGYCTSRGYDLTVIGVPKTVDNDLAGTDHAPGFASAARYVALSVQQAGRLFRDMQKVDQFVIYQSIGRDSGWLTAASIIAKQHPEDAPHLIYIPERRLNQERVLRDFQTVYKKYGWVSMVVSEGILWEDGTPVSATQEHDTSGNVEFGAMAGCSVAVNLHRFISRQTGLRGEFEVTESLPMCSADRLSLIDWSEAYECGQAAVELAHNGATDVMVSIQRTSNNPYQVSFEPVPIESIVNKPKPMDDRFIASEGNFITQDYIDYLKPLVGELPRFANLKAITVTA
ncbi:MAG: diphosphate--fructose-6-phosphate 1-phosphotransferase [Chitinivibrionales bacterium]|nr:diphosphate--fructose-6-phosphate 1-phosphotransferase [Chitinivibrionales bacterium]